MNNRFKFRGMTLGGEWVYGNLAIINEKIKSYGMIIDAGYYISNKVGMPFAYPVRPETVGQCTGLKDKNGKLIYEGDIVRVIEQCMTNTLDRNYPMLFNEKTAKFGFKHPDGHFFYFTNNEDFSYEIIGNIHSNPELLEADND